MSLELIQYQEKVKEFAVYPGQNTDQGLIYCALGLAGESGEIANKAKKILRDNDGVSTPEARSAIMKELGDVLWYVSQLATELGYGLNFIAIENLMKLSARREHGTIGGSGDDR